MIAWIASLQPLVIAALLTWAGVVKLRGLRTPEEVSRSAIGRIVGDERASLTWRLVGGLELTAAAALLLPPPHPVKPLAAGMLAAGFLGFLWYVSRTAPESSCGCLSSRPTKVSWRSFARAGALLVVALFAAGYADRWWPTAVASDWLPALAVATAELAGFLMLSPELDRRWLFPLRQLKVRLTHPLGDTVSVSGEVPLLASLQLVQQSGAYQRVGALLTSDVRDHWIDGEWRLLEYGARVDDKPATAVFAVPLHADDPESVRVAMVEEDPVAV